MITAKFKVGQVVSDKKDKAYKYRILIDHGVMSGVDGTHQTYLARDVQRGSNVMITEDALMDDSTSWKPKFKNGDMVKRNGFIGKVLGYASKNIVIVGWNGKGYEMPEHIAEELLSPNSVCNANF